MKTKHTALAAVLALTACTSQNNGNRSGDDATFVFTAGEVPITELVARCGAFLDWNILLTPQELQSVAKPATVTLERPIQTDREGCADLLSSLLWTKGFAITPLDAEHGVHEVVFLHGPRAREFTARTVHRTVEEVRARPDSYYCVTVIAPLQHINSVIATNALRPFFASTAGGGGNSMTLGNVGKENSLVLCGPQHTVVAALDLLRSVDVPSAAPAAPGLSQRVEELTRTVERLATRVEALEKK